MRADAGAVARLLAPQEREQLGGGARGAVHMNAVERVERLEQVPCPPADDQRPLGCARNALHDGGGKPLVRPLQIQHERRSGRRHLQKLGEAQAPPGARTRPRLPRELPTADDGRVTQDGLAAKELDVRFDRADAGGLGHPQAPEVVAGAVRDKGGRHRIAR